MYRLRPCTVSRDAEGRTLLDAPGGLLGALVGRQNGLRGPDVDAQGLFVGQHGSWNRSQAVGARVMVTFLNADGSVKESKPFAEGWLDEETNEYSGRPVDVAQLADGSLLVSDDAAGAIYRISYGDRN